MVCEGFWIYRDIYSGYFPPWGGGVNCLSKVKNLKNLKEDLKKGKEKGRKEEMKKKREKSDKNTLKYLYEA